MENQKGQEKQDLRDLNEGDRQHIIAFLKTFNLMCKSQMLYQSAQTLSGETSSRFA
jgi:hypothetical protein